MQGLAAPGLWEHFVNNGQFEGRPFRLALVHPCLAVMPVVCSSGGMHMPGVCGIVMHMQRQGALLCRSAKCAVFCRSVHPALCDCAGFHAQQTGHLVPPPCAGSQEAGAAGSRVWI